MNERIDFGIVNFNGGEALAKCIRSIVTIKNIDARIFVFDNASSDDSVVITRNAFPECTYIEYKENIGYAGACNKLLDQLTTEIIVLSNMDLEFDIDWGTNILNCFETNKHAASVSSAVCDKETRKLYSGGVYFFYDLFPLSSETLQSPDQPYEVFGSYGAVMTFRKSIFSRIGLFDEDYFLFFEETELYLRMNIYNLKTLYCPTAKVYHHRSISTIRYSPLKLFYSERNRVCTAFKYFPLWYFPFTFLFSIFRFAIMAKSGIPGSDGQGKKVSKALIIFTIAKSWIKALQRLPVEWKKRKKIWSQTSQRPSDTLTIIRKYKVSIKNLRIK